MTIQEIRTWAEKHYNDGADVIVECWDDEDIQEFLDDNRNLTDAGKYRLLDTYCSIWEDQRAIVEAKED